MPALETVGFGFFRAAEYSTSASLITRQIEQKFDRVRAISPFGAAIARCKPASAVFSGAADFPGEPVPDGLVAPDLLSSTEAVIYFQSCSRKFHIPLAPARPLWQFAARRTCSGPQRPDQFLRGRRAMGPHSSGVEHSLGKGEVESSNLSVGTISTFKIIQY